MGATRLVALTFAAVCISVLTRNSGRLELPREHSHKDSLASGLTASPGLLNLLFMADIGHPREYSGDLTFPWPMGRAATEGSHSLYDGLFDYIANQGMRPQAVAVVGDVAYGGGDAAACNGTRAAFQRYLNGQVPPDRVFPVIGNHDVHYLGCSSVEQVQDACFYGSNKFLWTSRYQMSFWDWRENWLAAFPGLRSALIPPPSHGSQSGHDAAAQPQDPAQSSHGGQRAGCAAEQSQDRARCGRDRRAGRNTSTHTKGPARLGQRWLAPSRYNLDLDNRSSVYLIAGLISGAGHFRWNGDTPRSSVDAAGPGGRDVECAFLRDSLAHGRRLGKTVFIYLTHAFSRGCDDWALIRQLDVWISGHYHTYWQSAPLGGTVVQEARHYPIRVLIGNGGFDSGDIGEVSFGHVQERVAGESDRVRLEFQVLDTCRSTKSCPSQQLSLLPACWEQCQDVAGGYDSGGGPRKALRSHRSSGFTLDAPRYARREPLEAVAPFQGSWKLRLGRGASARWVALGSCGGVLPSTARCLVPGNSKAHAAVFSFYDSGRVAGNPSARLAVADEEQGPVMRGTERRWADWLYRHQGFWSIDSQGHGQVRPSDGWNFVFSRGPEGWQALNLEWQMGGLLASDLHLAVRQGSSLSVSFHGPFSPS